MPLFPLFAPLSPRPSSSGHEAAPAAAAARAAVDGGSTSAHAGKAQGGLVSGFDFASRRAIFEWTAPAALESQGAGRCSLPSRAPGRLAASGQSSDEKEEARKALR